jgi:uncharacterized protein with GYD domain
MVIRPPFARMVWPSTPGKNLLLEGQNSRDCGLSEMNRRVSMRRPVFPAAEPCLLIAEALTRWVVRLLQCLAVRGGQGVAQRKEHVMPLFKLDFAYTPETWAAMIQAPEDRTEAVRAAAESAGGSLLGLYYAFGETDGFVLCEAPDSRSAAAVAMTVLASGRFRTIKTTEIFSAAEAVEAMRKAGGMRAQYRPPAQR